MWPRSGSYCHSTRLTETTSFIFVFKQEGCWSEFSLSIVVVLLCGQFYKLERTPQIN